MNAEEVVRTYSDMVYKIAYRHAMNPTDADDIYSETFLTYFKKEREFDSEEHRKAWLIRVAINASKDVLMSRSGMADIDEVVVASDDGNLDEKLALRAAIDQLPLQQKQVICMHYEHDLSIKQIANALEMSETNVKTTLFRARDRLRKLLGE